MVGDADSGASATPSDAAAPGPAAWPFQATVRADLERLALAWSYRALAGALFHDRTFRPIFTMRLCQALIRQPSTPSLGFRLRRRLLGRLAQWLHGLATQLAGIDLHWDTDIGPGFQICHGWGIVVSPGARIGPNCTFLHGVTIGQNRFTDREGRVLTLYPVIEADVWIGPHAVIVGAVTVGRGAQVAAGTLVTRNVPPRSIVAGNPMQKPRRPLGAAAEPAEEGL